MHDFDMAVDGLHVTVDKTKLFGKDKVELALIERSGYEYIYVRMDRHEAEELIEALQKAVNDIWFTASRKE